MSKEQQKAADDNAVDMPKLFKDRVTKTLGAIITIGACFFAASAFPAVAPYALSFAASAAAGFVAMVIRDANREEPRSYIGSAFKKAANAVKQISTYIFQDPDLITNTALKATERLPEQAKRFVDKVLENTKETHFVKREQERRSGARSSSRRHSI